MVESTLLKIACAGGTLTITADFVRLEQGGIVEVPRRDVLGVRAVRRPEHADLVIVAGRGERILLAEGVSFLDALRAIDALGTVPEPSSQDGSQSTAKAGGARVRAGDIRLLISPETVRAEGARVWSFPRTMIRGVSVNLAANWADVRLILADEREILAPQVQFESALRMIELLGSIDRPRDDVLAHHADAIETGIPPVRQSDVAPSADARVADASKTLDGPGDASRDDWTREGWQTDRPGEGVSSRASSPDSSAGALARMEPAPYGWNDAEHIESAAHEMAETAPPILEDLSQSPIAVGIEPALRDDPEPAPEAPLPSTPPPVTDVSSLVAASSAAETLEDGPRVTEDAADVADAAEVAGAQGMEPSEPLPSVPAVRVVPVVSRPRPGAGTDSARVVPVLSSVGATDADRTPTAPRLAIVKAPPARPATASTRATRDRRRRRALVVAGCLLVVFAAIAIGGYALTSLRSPATPTHLQTRSTPQATHTPAASAPAQAGAGGAPLYVAARDGTLYALDSHTGKLFWASNAAAHITTAATISQGTLYVGTQDSTVRALRESDKQQLWQFAAHGAIDGAPAVANGIVYASSHDNSLYALRASDGKLLWRYTSTRWFAGPPAVADGTVYANSYNSRTYAFNAITGRLLWSHIASGSLMSAPAVVGGVVYVSSSDNSLYALDSSTGRLLWRYTTGGSLVSSPAAGGGIVSVGSMDGAVYTLEAATGALRWKYQTPDSILGTPTVTDGTVFVGSTDAYIYALDATTGTPRWRYKTGGAVASWPFVSMGTVYMGSTDHNLYALDEQSGVLLWQFTTGGIVDSQPAIGG